MYEFASRCTENLLYMCPLVVGRRRTEEEVVNGVVSVIILSYCAGGGLPSYYTTCRVVLWKIIYTCMLPVIIINCFLVERYLSLKKRWGCVLHQNDRFTCCCIIVVFDSPSPNDQARGLAISRRCWSLPDTLFLFLYMCSLFFFKDPILLYDG